MSKPMSAHSNPTRFWQCVDISVSLLRASIAASRTATSTRAIKSGLGLAPSTGRASANNRDCVHSAAPSPHSASSPDTDYAPMAGCGGDPPLNRALIFYRWRPYEPQGFSYSGNLNARGGRNQTAGATAVPNFLIPFPALPPASRRLFGTAAARPQRSSASPAVEKSTYRRASHDPCMLTFPLSTFPLLSAAPPVPCGEK